MKYRGKRKNGVGWVYGGLISFKGQRTFIFPEIKNDICYRCISSAELKDYIRETVIEVLPETVGRFTTLLDKDSSEIYQGDKVLNNGSVWIIVWSDDAACYMMRHINDPTPGNENIFLWESKNSKVIGNIHEEK